MPRSTTKRTLLPSRYIYIYTHTHTCVCMFLFFDLSKKKRCQYWGILGHHSIFLCVRMRLLIQAPTNRDEAQKRREDMLRRIQKSSELLRHATECADRNCTVPNCVKIRMHWLHMCRCQVRVSGGCTHCKRMWAVLQMHARHCQDLNCAVPRCKDLKVTHEGNIYVCMYDMVWWL